MKAALSKKITLENATETEMRYWEFLGADELLNSASVELFEKAIQAGFFEWVLTNEPQVDFCDAEPIFQLRPTAALTPIARLAYWCKKASTYLGLDKGRRQETDKPCTNWQPFEKAFGLKGMRYHKYSITVRQDPEDYEKAADEFFAALEASDNEQK